MELVSGSPLTPETSGYRVHSVAQGRQGNPHPSHRHGMARATLGTGNVTLTTHSLLQAPRAVRMETWQ